MTDAVKILVEKKNNRKWNKSTEEKKKEGLDLRKDIMMELLRHCKR